MIEIAQPCRVRYQFYGNFKMYSSEMQHIMTKLNVSHEFFYDHPSHDVRTSELLETYFSQVSVELKRELFVDFYQELDFYYSLYPEESSSHIEILGVEQGR